MGTYKKQEDIELGNLIKSIRYAKEYIERKLGGNHEAK